MAEQKDFSAFDYVIFALMLAISAAIGIFYGCFGKKQKSSKDLLVANREMGVKTINEN
jgi:Na+/H+ antiporter NhaC